MAEGPAGLVHVFLRHILQEVGAPTWLRSMRAAGSGAGRAPHHPSCSSLGVWESSGKGGEKKIKVGLADHLFGLRTGLKQRFLLQICWLQNCLWRWTGRGLSRLDVTPE